MIGDARTGSGFGGLARYLHRGRKGDSPDRVAWTAARNLPTADPDLVPAMMRATASLSTRVRDPVFHYSISWPEYEQLPQDDMLKIADRTLEDLGLQEHQAIIVAHNDTAHPHIHVMVNRVHPETGVAWEKWKYKTRLETSLKVQEKELGLTEVPGRLSDPERARSDVRRPQKGEQRLAERLDVATLDHWSREDVAELRDRLALSFEAAESWSDLDRRVQEEGVTLYAKGPGIILTNGERYAKLSEMGKSVRKVALEERFGQSFSSYAEERQAARQQSTDYWGMLRGISDRMARAGKSLREWVFGRSASLMERLNRSKGRTGMRRRKDRDGPER
ncbi:MAG: relaxase/mobilization nuclease domain-containing protein [Parvibaculaceae bacterium]